MDMINVEAALRTATKLWFAPQDPAHIGARATARQRRPSPLCTAAPPCAAHPQGWPEEATHRASAHAPGQTYMSEQSDRQGDADWSHDPWDAPSQQSTDRWEDAPPAQPPAPPSQGKGSHGKATPSWGSGKQSKGKWVNADWTTKKKAVELAMGAARRTAAHAA